MSKGEVKNPQTDDRVKKDQKNKDNKRSDGRGGHTNPENQHDKQN